MPRLYRPAEVIKVLESFEGRVVAKQKFTVMLIPDDGGYQAIVPYYSNVVAWGKTPAEALANTQDTLESVLQAEAENGLGSVPYNVHASHMVIGEVSAEVSEVLMTELNEEKAKVRV